MQKYFNTILDEKGDPIGTASVLVKTPAGDTATIYSDNSGTTTGNPLSTSSTGYFEFYAPNGLYTVVASKTGKTTVTIENVLLDDPTVATIAALRAAGVPTTSNARVSVLGYTTAGDGGGGDFYWDSTSSAADDGGITFLPTGYAGTGRWKRILVNGEVTAKQFGLVGNGVTSDQTRMDALMASSAQCIRFTPGVYYAILANGTSNRTFIFDEGAIIDGVAHIATGTGPDQGGGAIVWVDNVRVIGTLTSTVRVGAYYARKLNADKFRVTEISASYLGQTAAGGSRGTHLYMGCHDFDIGEIIIDSTTLDLYALGIDHSTTVDADHKPTNIHIGKLTVRNNTQAAIVTADTVGVVIDNVYVHSHNGIGVGFSHQNDLNLKFGRVRVDSSSADATVDTIYLFGTTNATYDDVEIISAKQHGFRVIGSATARVGKLKVNGGSVSCVNLQSPATIDDMEVTGSAIGLWAESGATGSKIGKLKAYSNSNINISISATKLHIDEILTYSATNYGLVLNSTATDFSNRYIEAYSCVQGVRCLSAGPIDMGIMYLHDNTTGFAGSGMNKFSYLAAHYSANGTDSNVDFNGLAGFSGYLQKRRLGENIRGDADVTINPTTAYINQIFSTPLTVNRTITLDGTGAVAGDNFRVVRDAAATGASTLSVGGLKLLAVSQWCDVHYSGVSWRLIAYGTL